MIPGKKYLLYRQYMDLVGKLLTVTNFGFCQDTFSVKFLG